jgi:hypothetical protein
MVANTDETGQLWHITLDMRQRSGVVSKSDNAILLAPSVVSLGPAQG